MTADEKPRPTPAGHIAGEMARMGMRKETFALYTGVCLFFLLLPLHADASATIALMTLLALWVGARERLFSSLLIGNARAPLIAFMVFCAVALLASIIHPATFGKFPRVLLWAGCVFTGAMLSRAVPRHNSTYFWVLFMAIAGGFLVAWAVWGYGYSGIWHDGRLKLFAMHPSRLGVYCAVCFFFLLHRSITAEGKWRALAMLATALVFFLLYKTNTRGNLLMLPVGIFCMAMTLTRRQWKYFGAVIGICALLVAGTLWAGKGSGACVRLVSAVTNITADPTFRSRLPIWETGWEAFKKAPFIGHGMHSYLSLHAKYTKDNHDALTARYGFYEERVKQAHNIVLGRLVEVGILGTAMFFVFFLGAVWAAWRGPQEYRWIVAPLVFYIAMSMLDDGLFRINDAFIFFVAGTALGLPGRAVAK